MSDLARRPEQGIVQSIIPQRDPDDKPVLNTRTRPSRVHVIALTTDSLQQVWGCGDGGVVRWKLSSTQVKFKIWHPEHGLAGNDAVCLFADGERVFVGHTSGRISLYEAAQWTTLPYASSYAIRSFGKIEGRLFACTDAGLLDTANGNWWQTPAPVLCITAWQEYVWLGTTDGLWCWKDARWDKISQEKTLTISRLVPVGNYLWLLGETLYHMSRTKVITPLRHSCVRALVVQNQELIIAGLDGAGYLKARSTFISSDIPLYDAIQHREGLVFAAGKRVILWTAEKQQDLFPWDHSGPADAVQRYTTESEEWIQDSNGGVWIYRLSDDLWQCVLEHSKVALRGVVAFQEQVLLAFDDTQGLGVFDGKQLHISQALSFVFSFSATSEIVWAATVEGLYWSKDGTEWKLISYPSKMGIIDRVWLDNDMFCIEVENVRYGIRNGSDMIKEL